MDKYSIQKIFHHNLLLHVYMYDFMYVNTETIPVEEYFLDTKTCVDNYKKTSTPGQVPRYWHRFSCIFSEYYELDHNFDET